MSFQVIGYDPRPLIKITPASSASDRRQKTYNFVEAVRKLKTNFTPAEVEPIVRRINPELYGRIRTIFIVLTDDMVKPRLPAPKSSSESRVNRAPEGTNPPVGNAVSTSGDTESSSDESESAPVPPVPPPVPSTPATLRDKSSRNNKRGASSILPGPSAKK